MDRYGVSPPPPLAYTCLLISVSDTAREARAQTWYDITT